MQFCTPQQSGATQGMTRPCQTTTREFCEPGFCTSTSTTTTTTNNNNNIIIIIIIMKTVIKVTMIIMITY